MRALLRGANVQGATLAPKWLRQTRLVHEWITAACTLSVSCLGSVPCVALRWCTGTGTKKMDAQFAMAGAWATMGLWLHYNSSVRTCIVTPSRSCMPAHLGMRAEAISCRPHGAKSLTDTVLLPRRRSFDYGGDAVASLLVRTLAEVPAETSSRTPGSRKRVRGYPGVRGLIDVQSVRSCRTDIALDAMIRARQCRRSGGRRKKKSGHDVSHAASMPGAAAAH